MSQRTVQLETDRKTITRKRQMTKAAHDMITSISYNRPLQSPCTCIIRTTRRRRLLVLLLLLLRRWTMTAPDCPPSSSSPPPPPPHGHCWGSSSGARPAWCRAPPGPAAAARPRPRRYARRPTPVAPRTAPDSSPPTSRRPAGARRAAAAAAWRCEAGDGLRSWTVGWDDTATPRRAYCTHHTHTHSHSPTPAVFLRTFSTAGPCTTLQQPTQRRSVCLVAKNISSEAEITFISAILRLAWWHIVIN